MDSPKWTTLHTAEDVTDEILEIAVNITDGFYAGDSIDWLDVWDRMDNVELTDGTRLDVGEDVDTPALRKIKNQVRHLRRTQ